MTIQATDPSGINTFVLNTPDEWLSLEEAASFLGVTTRTISTYLRTGRIRATRLSSKVVRIRRSDLEKAFEKYATFA